MTTSDPRGMHDWHSPAYVMEWIDAYPQEERKPALRRIAHLIPFDPEQEIRVLDIGGGWGPVTEVVLETFPHARVVLHDFSQPMLEAAQRRLAPYAAAVTYVCSDLMSPDWTDAIAGEFDAVVSAIAIHNVRFPDRIKAIYREVFGLVAPGGCFINLDHVAFGELTGRANRQAARMDQRRRMYEETGHWTPLSEIAGRRRAVNTPHAHGEATSADRERLAAHEPNTLPNTLRWLLEVGFDEADCFGHDQAGALFAAYRRP